MEQRSKCCNAEIGNTRSGLYACAGCGALAVKANNLTYAATQRQAMKPAEYDQHVAYVAGELMKFARSCDSEEFRLNGEPIDREFRAEMVADDIVLWVTSKPMSRWPGKDFIIGYVIGAAGGAVITWLVLAI